MERSDYLGSDRVAMMNDGDGFDEYCAHLGTNQSYNVVMGRKL